MSPSFTAPWMGTRTVRSRPARWPADRQARIHWLEEHQRDLEQRAADAADRIRRLRQAAEAEAEDSRGRRPGRPAQASRRPQSGRSGSPSVLERPGPPGAATLVLLHGWGGTAAGNWGPSLPGLARHFHVVAVDLPGHDNEAVVAVAALLEARGQAVVVAVGYSLGSAVAYQLARRRPDLVDGVVLCAPAGVAPAAGEVGAPTAVVVTERDRLIPARRQLELARQLPGATVHRVDGNHFAFARPHRFVPALLDACRSVAERAGSRGTLV